MKKIIFSILLLSLFVIFIIYVIIPIILLGSDGNHAEDLLFTSTSPDNNIVLEVYLDNGSATVDYSVKVYKKTNTKKELIYNEYHQTNAEIKWIDNHIVKINNIQLDLSKNQTYDWRRGVRK